jgi:large conductance mechanosensitive channel
MIKEFREFIARGSVIDLAVGIVIGAAFTSVVNSLVQDIVMPPVGFFTGGVDFADLGIVLSAAEYPSVTAAREAGEAVIAYGLFINALISFLIVAFAIFMVIKTYNRIRAPQPAAAPTEPTEKECPHCFYRVPIAATRCAHCTSDLRAVQSV